MSSNRVFLKKVTGIICLTIGIASLFLPWLFKASISYISGALVSLGNIWWIYRSIFVRLDQSESRARLDSIKNFYLRYLVLILVSFILVKFFHINIILYGSGLIAGQVSIMVVQLLTGISKDSDQE